MTQIYNYSALTGEYTGSSTASESPLEPGVFLIPANATIYAPPTTAEHTIAIFTNDIWSITSDYRGTVVYSTINGSPTLITELGPFPIDTTTAPKPSLHHEWDGSTWILNVDLVHEAMWESIKAYRDNFTTTGGFHVANKWFHSDQVSRSQQLGLVLLGDDLQGGVMWKTMDGSFIEMTSILARQILIAAAVSDQTVFAIAETHKAAMISSIDPINYDYTTGWPATFAG